MGGFGSGRRRKVEFTESVQNLIKLARSHGLKWIDIANSLGYPDVDVIYDFRRENPLFDAECQMAFLQRKVLFANKLEKAAIPDNGMVNTVLAVRIAEQYGILEKESKTPLANIQVNNNEQALQVNFVSANPIQPKQISEIIDVKTD